METEKKKLLLVTISVGIFLVLVIGTAIFVIAPKKTPDNSAAITSREQTNISVPPPSGSQTPVMDSVEQGTVQTSPVDAVEMVRTSGDVPGLKAAPEGTARQGNDFYINGATQTVISVPKPATAAVPNAAPAEKTVSAPAPKKPAETPKPAATAAPKSSTPAAKAAPAQPKVYDDYWVQTGAFSTVAKAQGVKETLANKGITSIIENRDVDGKTLFRVRVGPYTSKNEADYWLSLIKSIGGFEDSQIRQTQSRR